MRTRMFRVGKVARCLTSKTNYPEAEEDHIIYDANVTREIAEMGHGGAGDEDDKAEYCNGEVRGG